MPVSAKLEAAIELLQTTKRNLQLVDEHIERLQKGKSAIEPAADVSSEHRASWLGAVDDNDQQPGILLGQFSLATSFGFGNPKTGTIRNQEDAAFVCTAILLAVGRTPSDDSEHFEMFSQNDTAFYSGSATRSIVPYLRLTDANTGRDLVVGMTEAPKDLGRGAVPFSYLSSFRSGLGSNIKNKLFSEFTIPRAGNVKATVFNLGSRVETTPDRFGRVCVSLLGYKVYGA